MCDNVEDRREAETRGLDATKTVCVTCPLRDGCGRLRQKGEGHDVWISTSTCSTATSLPRWVGWRG